MLNFVLSDGRVLALKPSEWIFLLGGVALCGFVTLFSIGL